MRESASEAVGLGRVDELAPDLLCPMISLEVRPGWTWFRRTNTLAVPIEGDPDEAWELWLAAIDRAAAGQSHQLVEYLRVWLRVYVEKEAVPATISDGSPLSWILTALDALRRYAFQIAHEDGARVLRQSIRYHAQRLPDRLRGPAEELGHALGDTDRLGAAILEFARALDAAGHLDEAAQAHRVAYEHAVVTSNGGQGIDAARGKARAERRSGRFDEALRWYELASRLSEFEEDWTRMARVLDGLANTYTDRGALPEARRVYAQASVVAALSDDPDVRAQIQHSMAGLAYWTGEFDVALGHVWEAIGEWRDVEQRAKGLLLLGSIFAELGALGPARTALQIASTTAVERDSASFAHCELGLIAAMEGDRGLFQEHFAVVDALRGDVSARCHVQMLLYRGRAHGILQDERAEVVLREALRFAEEHRFAREIIRAEEYLNDEHATAPSPTVGDEAVVREVADKLQAWAASLT